MPTTESIYQKRTKPTRTRLFRRIWNSLEVAERPDTLGWLNSFNVHIDPTYATILNAAGLDSVHGVFHTRLGKTVSHDVKMENDDVLRIELEQDGRTQTFFVKRYWNRDFNKIWNRAFRGALFGRAIVKSEYENIERLGSYGIRIPALVAYGYQRFCGGVVNSFIITEAIPNATGLDELLGRWMPLQPRRIQSEYKEALVAEVARNVKLMHAHGFEHHDLYLRNTMISGLKMTALYIFDCPRAYVWPQFIMRFRRIHDLVTLGAGSPGYLSSTQRMRFMHIYLGCRRLSPQDKSFVRKVLQCAEPKRERQIARMKRDFSNR